MSLKLQVKSNIMPETGGLMGYKIKRPRKEYKVKRVVIYHDGNHQEMTGTRSFFRRLWSSDKSIHRVWRLAWWEKKMERDGL